MADWTAPRTWVALENPTAALLNTHLRDNLTYLYDNLPYRATLFHDALIVESGNGLTISQNSNQMYNYFAYQSGASDGDTFTHSFVVGAGTYTLSLLGHTATNCGLLDIEIDGVQVESGQDWYAASAWNVIKTVADIVISTGGYHTLTGIVNGKNALSTDYYIFLTKYWLRQASD